MSREPSRAEEASTHLRAPNSPLSVVQSEAFDNVQYSSAQTGDFLRLNLNAKRQKKLLIARATFTSLFLLMLVLLTIFYNDKQQYLAEGECIRDYTFVWTSSVNTFLINNTPWKDGTIIQSSVCIDAMMISYLVIYVIWGSTLRLAVSLILFYPIRNVIQTIMLMGRPVGFLWSFPGIISLTVPYFDTNDFFFSGHVGSTTMYASEYFAMNFKKMAIIISLCIIDVWIALTFLYTHYIIDFTAGFACARFVHRIAEKLSYYPDVKALGYPKEKRYAMNYTPCPKCGWGNDSVLLLADKEEIQLQRKLYAGVIMEQTKNSGTFSPIASDEEGLRERDKPGDQQIHSINNSNSPYYSHKSKQNAFGCDSQDHRDAQV